MSRFWIDFDTFPAPATALLIVLALLGDARIFLFVWNRVVFGNHREEQPKWAGLWIATPLLLVLTFFWPWVFVAAVVGVYWLASRFIARLRHAAPIPGVETHEPRVVRLRKAHIPFAFLRNLGAHNDVYDLEVTRHDVFIDDLPPPFDGYRLAFLTDTHVTSFMRRGYYREIVAQVQEFDPDVVLFGGDFVSWKKHVPLMAELLTTGLSARDGVYAVPGNHDYWAGIDEVIAALTAKGVEFVVNRSVALERDGAALALTGIDEMYRGEPDVDRALDAAAPVRIAISHHPDIIDLLGGRRIDLLLCGHTHGGQIRLPFFGPLIIPSRHEARYASGFHRVGGVLLYVSRGIGAVPPLRILCRPEVATFVLRRTR